jgi:hypothetical protein
MAAVDTEWQAEVLRLKAEGKSSAEIAEAVGKHAATVRKVIARNPPWPHENGHATVDAETADRIRKAAEGQTDVYDHLAEDDPEHPDTLAEFRGEAGEPVGDMPGQTPPDAGDYEVRLKGTRQLALDFGPNADAVVGATIVLKSDKLASGFYGLGDVITGTFTARVVDVAGKERLQRASGEFRAQPQHHVALITDLTVA